MKIPIFLLGFLLSGTSAAISVNVVGGINASIATYEDAPWIVSLQLYDGDYAYCGGTLINVDNITDPKNGWVVTAASCVDESVPKTPIATLGNIKLDPKASNQTYNLTILDTIIHVNYSSTTNDYDIALLSVEFQLEENEIANITYLDFKPMGPINESLYEFMSATLFGWGLRAENGPPMKELWKVPLPLVTDLICTNYYGHEVIDGHSMLCAGTENWGPCSYDTGSPLVCEFKNKDVNFTYLCGITSFGTGCGRRQLPGIFADVLNLGEWIEGHIDKT